MGLLEGDLLAGDLCADLFGRPVAPSPEPPLVPPLPEPLALFLALFLLEWGIASGDEGLAGLRFAFAGRSNNTRAFRVFTGFFTRFNES